MSPGKPHVLYSEETLQKTEEIAKNGGSCRDDPGLEPSDSKKAVCWLVFQYLLSFPMQFET